LPVALLVVAPPRAGLPGERGLRLDRVAAAALAVLALGGMLAWRVDVGEHQAVRMQYAAIAATAAAHAPGTVAPTIVVYQDPAVRRTRSGRIMASTMVMAVRQELGGALPRWCRGLECLELAARGAPGSVIHLGQGDRPPDIVGIVMPPPPGWI
ncbi:MAG TPA: hypothetical protein VFN43_10735, partial [Humibacillus sp.]|nr:hypothetical protein [Humibacillus sp.]